MTVKVSIIIPAYNAERPIRACLHSLLNLNFPREAREIIVVDNGSTDRTPEMVKEFPVQLLVEKRRGPAAARNRGIKAAQGELLAFTDSDCTVHPDWLTELIKPLGQAGIGISGGGLKSAPASTLTERYIDYRGVLSQEKMITGQHPLFPAFAITANAAIPRAVFDRVGYFDEALQVAGEDADLCWRIQWAGYQMVYVPEAIAYHHHRSSWQQLLRLSFSYGMGNVGLFKKHQRRWGKTVWIDPRPYIWLIKAVGKIPYAYFFKHDRLEKHLPLLDMVNNLGFISGKLYGSLKTGCLAL